MKKMKLILAFFLAVLVPSAVEAAVFSFDCRDSKVQGSIKYAVIGSYQAGFEKCSGMIVYDEASRKVEFVHVQIAVKSIHSQCPWCDRIVLSKQLLDPAVYPFIVFKSDDLRQKSGDAYRLKGWIDMHGVSKPVRSEFTLKQDGRGALHLKGDWVLRRKDFNIVWNKVLDHGGVLVGEDMIVSWRVNAHRE